MLRTNMAYSQGGNNKRVVQGIQRELVPCRVCGVNVRKDRMIKHLEKVHGISSIMSKFSQKKTKGSSQSILRESLRERSIDQCSKIYPYEFIMRILKKEFNEYFVPVEQYRLMFASDNHLIYFENTNQDRVVLHYRINESPLRYLKSNNKAMICLTDLHEGNAYLIPFDDILSRMSNVRWHEPHLGVTIDKGYYSKHVWKELRWNIKKYLISY